MTIKAKFKSDAFEAIHSAAGGLYRAGTIDKATMRGFDESCLATPPPIAPEEIKRIREQAHVSQRVLARYLTPANPRCRSGRQARSDRAAWRSSCWPSSRSMV